MLADTVFAFNAYHIGKERCYFQVACALGLGVWVSARRHQTLRRLDLPAEWLACITNNKQAAGVIVSDSGVGPPALQALHQELGKPVIGFQCTGALLLAAAQHPMSPESFVMTCSMWCCRGLPIAGGCRSKKIRSALTTEEQTCCDVMCV